MSARSAREASTKQVLALSRSLFEAVRSGSYGKPNCKDVCDIPEPHSLKEITGGPRSDDVAISGVVGGHGGDRRGIDTLEGEMNQDGFKLPS